MKLGSTAVKLLRFAMIYKFDNPIIVSRQIHTATVVDYKMNGFIVPQRPTLPLHQMSGFRFVLFQMHRLQHKWTVFASHGYWAALFFTRFQNTHVKDIRYHNRVWSITFVNKSISWYQKHRSCSVLMCWWIGHKKHMAEEIISGVVSSVHNHIISELETMINSTS